MFATGVFDEAFLETSLFKGLRYLFLFTTTRIKNRGSTDILLPVPRHLVQDQEPAYWKKQHAHDLDYRDGVDCRKRWHMSLII